MTARRKARPSESPRRAFSRVGVMRRRAAAAPRWCQGAYTGAMNVSEEIAAAPLDPIPGEDFCQTTGPTEAGLLTQQFLAFNTVITLQAFGPEAAVRAAFDAARAQCRVYERLFSRTLEHSDIARLNGAGGQPVAVHEETAILIEAALGYCAASEGLFDITIGKAVGLWNFRDGQVADANRLREAMGHVDWRGVHVKRADDGAVAWLDDPRAALDLGGIAKGWIADELTVLLVRQGVSTFVVNLGGNVVAHGLKPDGAPWKVGLQNPFERGAVVGAVALSDASAVTSGTYERGFEKDGVRYHHILDPRTGFPVETDAAGVTVIARRSIDAEGFSTTLLAMGIERGLAFACMRPEILNAYFVDNQKRIYSLD